MKTSTLLALTLAAPLAFAQTPPAAAPATPAAGCATVEIQNVRPQQGSVMVAAYGSADSYGKKPLVQVRVPAGEASMSVQLCGLSGTEVALMLFQDLDGDGKMARNMMGMPTEPWGSSGNPGMFGPKWDTGKVALDGAPIAVKMSI
jgi:uncharacterized protein (DUF2141 family)